MIQRDPALTQFAYRLVVFLLLIGVGGTSALAQDEVNAARQYLIANASKQNLTAADVEASVVSSAYRSPTTGWYHVYFNQAVQSVEVYNALLSVVLTDGQVRHATNNYVPGALTAPTVGDLKARMSPLMALQRAAASVGFSDAALGLVNEVSSLKLPDGTPTKAVFRAPALSNDKVDVRLYWLPRQVGEANGKKRDKLVLAWHVRFLTQDGQTGWNVQLNATTGEVLHKFDDVIHCSFGTPDHQQTPHDCRPDAAYFGVKALPKPPSSPAGKPAFAPNSYTVFDYPLESPNHGNRSVVTNPYTRFAPAGAGPGATNGWHSDGSSNYTITRGNNVWASEDVNSDNVPGSSPNSATLDFDHPYAQALNTAAANQSAAITNLFYWNNLIHDVLWRFGFDEPSGNFQANNQGRGGAGNDFIYADAQDGSGTNNANFSTPPDGSNGRMQMYLWNYPTNYQADSDFDNAIIAHEYGHGWSIRLTGGPNNVSCLWNAEQGGEGWSDYLGLMLTTNWASLSPTVTSANIPRGIGTYVLGQATSGAGIRPYRYSYDMTNVNGPVTYAKVGDLDFSQPHGIGSIWCTMLWDMTWEIILQDGYINPNVYEVPANLTDMRGNVAALKLVNEGLRLQPCSPSFVQARDAILQADQMLFGGRYRCALGRAFARRGLGANASTGSSTDDRVVTEDFSPIGGTPLTSPNLTTACSGAVFAYTATANATGAGFSWTRPAVSGISSASASGSSALVNETLVNTTNVPITVRYLFVVTPDVCAGVTPVQQVVRVVVYPLTDVLLASYSVCQGGSVPAGAGLRAKPFVSSSQTGALSNASGTYVRASGDNTTVYSPGESVFFRSYTVVAPVSGPTTIGVVSASFTANDNDTYLSLYQTAFDPGNPATNFVRGDDDSGAGLLSSLTHELVQGTTYVLVVASYQPNVSGTFALQSGVPLFEQSEGNSVDGLILSSSGTFNRPSGGTVYYPSGVMAYFTSHTVVAPLSGPVTFEITSASLSNGTDTYLALYQTAFNPASPGTNFLQADDDSGEGLYSKLTQTLTSGATYVIVTTTYSSSITGSFTLQASVPMFPAGHDLGWFREPVGGSPLARGLTFNPVGVPGSGIPNTATAGTTTFYLSKATSVICRQPVTFTIRSCNATSFDSAVSGNWNVPGTWTCNCIPDGSLPVRIQTNHTVTIPDAVTGQAKGLHLIGDGKVSLQGTGKVLLN